MDIIDLRHYSISTKPVGLPRSVRKTSVASSALPNLGKFEDVADFVLNANAYESASEIDEDEKVEIQTPSVKQETPGSQQRAIKLAEIGPRLRLELVKIEEGMCDGKVLYHRYVQKTKVVSYVIALIVARGKRFGGKA
jgi:ribosome biogenesis protein SSF1/2